MLFRWVKHPDFHAYECLMAVMYELGISTIEQLTVITGWKERTIINLFNQIKTLYLRDLPVDVKKEDLSTEEIARRKEQYLLTISFPNKSDRPNKYKRAAGYTLGVKGMDYVHYMRRDEGKRREAPRQQSQHFVGITNILIRLLEAGADPGRLQWFNSYDAADRLISFHEDEGAKIDRKDFIRPDALLVTELNDDQHMFWIEYDNDTENTRKIERKFHQYVKTMHPKHDVSLPGEIVWVAPTEHRRDYLRDIWEYMKSLYYVEAPTPSMHFFTNIEDVYFLQKFAFRNKVKAPSL